jgi:glycosyltransferase involved in cell wall biosynthesis
LSINKVLYVGRHLRPYRLNFLRAISENFELRLMVESGSELLDQWTASNTYTYKNLVMRDVEGFRSKIPNLYFSPGLYWGLLKSDVDVVIFEGTSLSFFIASLIMRIKGVKIIISFERTLHTERYNKWYRIKFHKILLKILAHGILANGIETEKYLKSIDRKALIYTRNVFPDIPQINKTLNRDYDILFVGQLIHRKGYRYLLELVEFVSKNKELKICIVGDGYFYSELKNRTYGRENIELIKKLNYQDVLKKMNESKFLFLPTLEDNWSLVTFEAAINGCVPITTKYNGALDGDVFDASNSIQYDFESDFWEKHWNNLRCEKRWKRLSENCRNLVYLKIYGDLKRYLQCF